MTIYYLFKFPELLAEKYPVYHDVNFYSNRENSPLYEIYLKNGP
ncbi:hypothetical protein Y11_38951 [Yersinia enterocolitica subsp. palearctica Y11]|uniref:Uncharacterized protein n=1 Tax=Yersinia enterocolitica subsp. palearctica serotype O:3 (strain DSM 13030 / CIP 106945 / Y11) TaxID=930944 RepID=A0A0H3NTS5_YERE1|nr:hypothetical protein Y11_38951 [Yersinia enterocolitica subsp. palearctica Y11]